MKDLKGGEQLNFHFTPFERYCLIIHILKDHLINNFKRWSLNTNELKKSIKIQQVEMF